MIDTELTVEPAVERQRSLPPCVPTIPEATLLPQSSFLLPPASLVLLTTYTASHTPIFKLTRQKIAILRITQLRNPIILL